MDTFGEWYNKTLKYWKKNVKWRLTIAIRVVTANELTNDVRSIE